jgi:hypothetical protein
VLTLTKFTIAMVRLRARATYTASLKHLLDALYCGAVDAIFPDNLRLVSAEIDDFWSQKGVCGHLMDPICASFFDAKLSAPI